MAIFNSYVSLPEGIIRYIYIYQGLRAARLRRCHPVLSLCFAQFFNQLKIEISQKSHQKDSNISKVAYERKSQWPYQTLQPSANQSQVINNDHGRAWSNSLFCHILSNISAHATCKVAKHMTTTVSTLYLSTQYTTPKRTPINRMYPKINDSSILGECGAVY